MSKYGNKRTTVDGQTFDSMREAEHFRTLLVQRFAKEPHQRVKTIECQAPYDLHALGGKLVCRYLADFRVTFADDRIEVQDVKSPITAKHPTYRIKAKWMLAEYGIKIVEVE